MPPARPSPSPLKRRVATGIYYLALLGALGGTAQHLLNQDTLVNELIPVARMSSGEISPVFRFWGGYAIASCTFAIFVASLYGEFSPARNVARKMSLLYTGMMFFGFATAWLLRGEITGKKDHLAHSANVYVLSGVFFVGFFLTDA